MSASNIKLLENYIGYLSTKNKVISQNIANIGTEGYVRQNVKFNDILQSEMNSKMKTTDKQHIKFAQPTNITHNEVYLDKNKEPNGGINNVDIETEMADLAENTINFKFASKKIAAQFKELSEVIKGGRG